MQLMDSPLSITASIAGILTFVVAVAAGVYVRLSYLRNADSEYFQVKASLSWYKTESTWMQDLVQSTDSLKSKSANQMEHEMYVFVMDQLGKLEERLLELLTEAEDRASREPAKEKRWTIVPQSVRFTTNIAVGWLPVRTKALELVRQRDALGSRVLFAQMSMMSSRVRSQDLRSRNAEAISLERLNRLERIVDAQNEKLEKLVELVDTITQTRRPTDTSSKSPNGESDFQPSRSPTQRTEQRELTV